MEVEHRETLEEEATHATDEARIVLPGIQAIFGFQLIAVFNQRFQDLSEGLQVLHVAAFLLLAVAMGLVMAPAGYHRQAERGCITRRFVDFASRLLSLSLVPLTLGIVIDTYLLVWLVVGRELPGLCVAGGLLLVLVGLWFVVPQLARQARERGRARLAGPEPHDAARLLDRDGVVIVNRPTNVKTPADLELLPGVPEAIARLNEAGFDVAICTNQPEVARGILSQEQLHAIHEALEHMLAVRNARVDLILCCGYDHKCPRRKPSAGMLREALARYRAIPGETPFVGDQGDDLKAAFHAGCKRVLVRTGLGRKTLEQGLPQYLAPVAVHDDLAAVVGAQLAGKL